MAKITTEDGEELEVMEGDPADLPRSVGGVQDDGEDVDA